MSKFENFILSDAFFPILIILLIFLVGVFFWIIKHNKKSYYRNVHHSKEEDKNAILYNEALSDINSVTDEELEQLLNGNMYEMPELKQEQVEIENEVIVSNDNTSLTDNNLNINENEIKLNQDNEILKEDKKDILNTNNLVFDDTALNTENNKIEEKNESKDLGLDDISQFPDFSSIENLTKKEEVENSKIEEDIMDAANKYIQSIMSNK